MSTVACADGAKAVDKTIAEMADHMIVKCRLTFRRISNPPKTIQWRYHSRIALHAYTLILMIFFIAIPPITCRTSMITTAIRPRVVLNRGPT